MSLRARRHRHKHGLCLSFTRLRRLPESCLCTSPYCWHMSRCIATLLSAWIKEACPPCPKVCWKDSDVHLNSHCVPCCTLRRELSPFFQGDPQGRTNHSGRHIYIVPGTPPEFSENRPMLFSLKHSSWFKMLLSRRWGGFELFVAIDHRNCSRFFGSGDSQRRHHTWCVYSQCTLVVLKSGAKLVDPRPDVSRQKGFLVPCKGLITHPLLLWKGKSSVPMTRISKGARNNAQPQAPLFLRKNLWSVYRFGT